MRILEEFWYGNIEQMEYDCNIAVTNPMDCKTKRSKLIELKKLYLSGNKTCRLVQLQ